MYLKGNIVKIKLYFTSVTLFSRWLFALASLLCLSDHRLTTLEQNSSEQFCCTHTSNYGHLHFDPMLSHDLTHISVFFLASVTSYER